MMPPLRKFGAVRSGLLAVATFASAVLGQDRTDTTGYLASTDSQTTVETPASPAGVELEPAKPAAATKDKKKARYRPPRGFAGHAWGKPFGEFDRLHQSPITLDVAYSPGVTTIVESLCPAQECDLGRAIQTLRQKVENRGFHLFAEFVVPDQGFRYRSTGVLMYPVTYQFCAQWSATSGTTGRPPDDILDRMKLCGVRMVFKSQALHEVAQMPDDALTNYELILQELMQEYGKPAGYSRTGQVIIETLEERIAERRKRRFRTWRWCPPIGRDFATTCEASIVFGFNPESGNGVVLYATRAVWDFAYARDKNVPGHDPLYLFLHGYDR